MNYFTPQQGQIFQVTRIVFTVFTSWIQMITAIYSHNMVIRILDISACAINNYYFIISCKNHFFIVFYLSVKMTDNILNVQLFICLFVLLVFVKLFSS